jgi:hypothetical protein
VGRKPLTYICLARALKTGRPPEHFLGWRSNHEGRLKKFVVWRQCAAVMLLCLPLLNTAASPRTFQTALVLVCLQKSTELLTSLQFCINIIDSFMTYAAILFHYTPCQHYVITCNRTGVSRKITILYTVWLITWTGCNSRISNTIHGTKS